MRVLHVVTLVSPDGAYGGPVRVAFNQAGELGTRHVDVVISGGMAGFDSTPAVLEGVSVVLFRICRLIPKSGFAGLAAPRQIVWFLRERRRFDTVHVHLARDLITPVIAGLAIMLGKPVHVQTHGMIDRSDRLLSKPFDLLLIRPILRRAASVFYLTQRERNDIEYVESRCSFVHLPNGVPRADVELALASNGSGAAPLDVIYVARLQERKHPQVFVRAAVSLLNEGADATFTLIGPDEGEGAHVAALIEQSAFSARIAWDGPQPPRSIRARMSAADVYVLPAVDEPFPMAVLEAMSVGLPVIITQSCGLADVVTEAAAGIVVDGSVESVVVALRRYRDDAQLRRQHGDNAKMLVVQSFSMTAVGSCLLDRYRESVGRGTPMAAVGKSL